MKTIKELTTVLESGNISQGFNDPIRTVMHEDSRYSLYACPIKGTEIDETILQSIKAEVETLEIGEIRYDSVEPFGYTYYIVVPDTGRHILTNGQDMNSIMENCSHKQFYGQI